MEQLLQLRVRAFVADGITDFTGRFELAVSPINTDYLFASAMGTDGTSSVSRLWHSIDGGANWVGGTETSTSNSWLGAQGWYDNTIVCHPTDPTILDANITTGLTAIILLVFGSGPIKGFAITLMLGIITSMFTAIVGTRAVINLIYGHKRVERLSI